jgi:predicted SnoaL-like aldol condensation-catalyzing enzyme
MEGQIHVNPKLVGERLQKALNEHDVNALVDCIDPFYFGEEPAHPDRAFRGREKIRTQYSTIFSLVPDFKVEIVRHTAEADAIWIEWHWFGTRADKTKLDMRGVSIMGVRENRVTWSRVYMEPVEVGGGGLEATTEQLFRVRMIK